jgi:predicted nucleic acid-binding protein
MIVSDSSTLIILFDLDKIELLQNISNKVYIPQTVYNEINYKYIVNLPNYFEIIKITQNDELYQLKMLLDDGESEAILLAKQMKLPLIIDEKKGRKIAVNMGVDIIGLLGIVYINIQLNKLSKNDAKKFLDMVTNNGFRISKKLILNMLNKIG